MPTLGGGQAPAEAINAKYQHVLRRDANSAGLSDWVAQFTAFSFASFADVTSAAADEPMIQLDDSVAMLGLSLGDSIDVLT
jgi:hypothetical protein